MRGSTQRCPARRWSGAGCSEMRRSGAGLHPVSSAGMRCSAMRTLGATDCRGLPPGGPARPEAGLARGAPSTTMRQRRARPGRTRAVTVEGCWSVGFAGGAGRRGGLASGAAASGAGRRAHRACATSRRAGGPFHPGSRQSGRPSATGAAVPRGRARRGRPRVRRSGPGRGREAAPRPHVPRAPGRRHPRAPPRGPSTCSPEGPSTCSRASPSVGCTAESPPGSMRTSLQLSPGGTRDAPAPASRSPPRSNRRAGPGLASAPETPGRCSAAPARLPDSGHRWCT